MSPRDPNQISWCSLDPTDRLQLFVGTHHVPLRLLGLQPRGDDLENSQNQQVFSPTIWLMQVGGNSVQGQSGPGFLNIIRKSWGSRMPDIVYTDCPFGPKAQRMSRSIVSMTDPSSQSRQWLTSCSDRNNTFYFYLTYASFMYHLCITLVSLAINFKIDIDSKSKSNVCYMWYDIQVTRNWEWLANSMMIEI